MLVIGESPIRRLTRLTARRSGTVGASSLGNRPSTRLLASGTRCRSAMRLARMPSAVSSGDRPKLRSFVPINRTTALAGAPSRSPFANRHNRWSVRSPLMPAFSTPRGSRFCPHTSGSQPSVNESPRKSTAWGMFLTAWLIRTSRSSACRPSVVSVQADLPVQRARRVPPRRPEPPSARQAQSGLRREQGDAPPSAAGMRQSRLPSAPLRR